MVNLVFRNKNIIFLLIFCLSGTISQVNSQENSPPWINNDPPEDEIWGFGMAKLINSRNSMDLAELRARTEITSHISSRVVSRINDDEFNNMSIFFILFIHMEASFEIINDTRVLERWESPDGTSWCLIAMKKSDAIKYTSIIENIFEQFLDEINEAFGW